MDSVATSGPLYEKTRRVWNGAVTNRPALVVHARGTADVQAAVRAARDHDLPLSVRSGGHDWLGRGVRDGALVIDLTGMRRVEVDAGTAVATVAGGATAADLIGAASPHGLSAVTGTVGDVGVAGLTLAGGYGPLNGRCGLALDNLLAADVVLADGRAVTADADHEPELFWAIRGGGGNFGVVTSMRLRLHRVDPVLAATIFYPLPQAAAVLDGLNEILSAAPDELTVAAAMLTGPSGAPGLGLLPVWSGDPASGEAPLDRLRRLGDPAVAKVEPTTYSNLLHANDEQPETIGHHVATRTRSLPHFTPDAISALVEAAATFTSPMSRVLCGQFHGAAARVPVESTAFGLRQNHVMATIVGWWPPGDAEPHQTWADTVSEALARDALPGGYPNGLGPDDSGQTAHAYGPNAARLRAAKTRYDPSNTFTATPLP
ncbi:FAD-binding oxidoreductase [Actinomadura soli]|uniref:FAD-binding oxidoreductase n=1 Tax=Actinomadura soli TaxID=2508997 RepID=A0A5C4J100_9ACTN|nr:FAD-binding oxidoreductase [Actinomadura soli]